MYYSLKIDLLNYYLTLLVLSITVTDRLTIFGNKFQSSKWKPRSWPKGPVLSLITRDFIFFSIRRSLKEAMVSVSVYLFLISMSKSHRSLIIAIFMYKMERTLFILRHSITLWNHAIATDKANKNKIWWKKSQIFESILR